MKLTKEEAQLIMKKLEYRFKKNATEELTTKPESEWSEGAKVLDKLIDIIGET
jgi:hypothetical protein